MYARPINKCDQIKSKFIVKQFPILATVPYHKLKTIKKPMKNLILVSILALIIACNLSSKKDLNSKNIEELNQILVKAPIVFDSLRAEINQFVSKKKIPAFAVAVIQNNKVIWEETFGQLSIDDSTLATPHSVFGLGSTVKSMTASVILNLIEEEKIYLDVPVETYLPEKIKMYGRKSTPTVRELLSMTGGISHGWISINTDDLDFGQSEYDFTKHYNIVAFPSGVFEYSNYSFGVLEQIIESVTEKKYMDVMQRELFKPLLMKNSYISIGNKTKLEKNIVHAYPLFSWQFIPGGAGGAHASLHDMILYTKYHLNDAKGIVSIRKDEKYQNNVDSVLNYTAGWGNIVFDDNLTWLVSNGSIAGANTCLSIIPEKNIAVICLANENYNNMADAMSIKIADVLVEGFMEKVFSKIGEVEALDAKPLEKKDIKYENWYGDVIISEENKFPVNFSIKTDSFMLNYNNSGAQIVKNAIFDHQSILRGDFSIKIKNPFTGEIEPTSSSLNLFVSEGTMKGYISVRYGKEGVYDIAIPYYIELNKKIR